jgi:pyoverdine/dityrosine biosynthesis protein Dit1
MKVSATAHKIALSLGFATPSLYSAPFLANSPTVKAAIPQKIIRPHNQVQKVTQAIVTLFKDYALPYDIDRRSVDSSESMTLQEIQGLDAFEHKIRNFVEKGQRIELYMIGFPFKSSNRDKKTISHLPDMAERSTFVYLNKLLSRITQIYPEGIRLTIVCDGSTFADVLGIPDQHLVDYELNLCQLITDMPAIRLITSQHLSQGLNSLQSLRSMIERMPPYEDELKKKFEESSDMNRELETTLKRLALELDHAKGKSHIKQKGLENITKAVVARSLRFSNYIKDRFPEFESYIKLSVHFQKDVSKKFGIKLSETSHVTPWHGTLVIDKEGNSTICHKMDIDMSTVDLESESINGIWCPYFKERSF